MEIKDLQGITIKDVPITESAVKVEELMKQFGITLSWTDTSDNVLPVGSYIEYEGVKYVLFAPYSPEQGDLATYAYKPVFEHPIMRWQYLPFFFYTYSEGLIISKELDWSLTGNPTYFMAAICDAIFNETGENWTYEISADLPSSVSLTFSNVDIFSGLNSISGAFGTEWWFDYANKIVYLSKANFGDLITLEVGQNIGVPSKSQSKNGYYTRFYAFGSTRNIEQNYEGSNVNSMVNKRLTLNPEKYPNGYIDIKEGLAESEVLVKVLTFDEIYPRSSLSISDVKVRLMWRLDDNSEKIQIGTDSDGNPVYDQYAIWYFKVPGLSFTQELLIKGKALSVHFNSGALSGREFELTYHDSNKTVESSDGSTIEVEAGDYEINFIEEGTYIIPAITSLIPADGDSVTLFNIVMPEEYKESAYDELEEETLKAIDEQGEDKNNYSFDSNSIAFYEDNPNLTIGRSVLYKNGDYTLNTRVIKLETQLDHPFEQKITVGNNQIKGTTQTLKEEVVNANQNIELISALNNSTQQLVQSYQRVQKAIQDSISRWGSMWVLDKEKNAASTPLNLIVLGSVLDELKVAGKLISKTLVIPTTPPSDLLLGEWGFYLDESGEGAEVPTTGSIDEDTFWSLLGTNITDKVIDDSHIPSLAISKITGLRNELNSKLDSTALNGYATKEWVEGKGYLTKSAAAATYATLTSLATTNSNLSTLRNEFDALESLLNDDTSGVIDTWNEVVEFLEGYSDSEDLASILSAINGNISTLQGYFTSGSANNALKLGGVALGGLFTSLASNTSNVVSVTVGGVTKSITRATMRTSLGLGSFAYINSLAFSSLTDKPTTLAGYGITDALSSSTKYALADAVGGNALNALKLGGILAANYWHKGNAGSVSYDWSAKKLVVKTLVIPTTTPSGLSSGEWGFYLDESGVGAEVPSGGGGSGDISADIWAELGNYDTKIIDASHIPSLGISKISGLQNSLDAKVNASALASVATSGKYSDLSGTPTSLKNPTSLSWSGYSSGSYDGSSAKSFVIPTSLPASDVYAWAKKSSLAASDVPNLDWSKITSGKPTTLAGYGITDFVRSNVSDSINNYTTQAGIYRLSSYANSATPDKAGYGTALTLYAGADTWSQIYVPYTMSQDDAGLYWRGATTSTNNPSWRRVLDSTNYTSYTYSQSTIDTKLAGYLPLSGGTLTGELTISEGNFIVKTGDTVTRKLYPAADNVYEFGQGGRRWSNVHTILINGGTPIHSGNIGSYNAGSATKLQTARSIWGQSFDGSANVSGDLSLGANKIIGYNDYSILSSSSSSTSIAHGAATYGISTYLNGYNVHLRYGASRATGLLLNSIGNVLIGLDSGSGAKLEVNGATRIHSSVTANNSIILFDSENATRLTLANDSTASAIYSYDGSAFRDLYLGVSKGNIGLLIKANRNVLIGTTNDNGSGAKLQVNGDITASGKIKGTTLIVPTTTPNVSSGEWGIYLDESGVGAEIPTTSSIDEDTFWSLLGTNITNKVIDDSHIPSLTISKIIGLRTELDGKLNSTALNGYASKEWVEDKGYTTNKGTVTSVAMSVPTGFAISGTPITTSGTLALTFASGYSLPTTAKQSNWDTAYSWGNHASKGYALASALATTNSNLSTLRNEFDALESLLNDDTSGVIDTWNEVVEFLEGYSDSEDLASILSVINGNISTLQGYFTNGSANNALKLGGVALGGLFTSLASNTSNVVSVTVGGVTKSITRATMRTSLGLGSFAYINSLAFSSLTDKPTTLAGYGITDALSSSTKYALADAVGGNALNALKLGGIVASNYWHTGNAGSTSYNWSAKKLVVKTLVIPTTTPSGLSSGEWGFYLDESGVGGETPSGGGGSGDISADIWAELGNYNTKIIDASHIPSLGISKISGLQNSLDAKVNATALASVATSGKYSDLSGTPTSLKNPYALTFGSKTYDGSSAKTITASDLGALTSHQSLDGYVNEIATSGSGNAVTSVSKSGKKITFTKGSTFLTSHQTIYALTIKNSAGTTQVTYTPNSAASSITLTKAMVGLSNVENTALSTWVGTNKITTLGTITTGVWNGSAIANSYLANSSMTIAGTSVALGGSITTATLKSNLGLKALAYKDSITTTDVAEGSNLYFTNARAISACDGTYLKLSGGTLTSESVPLLINRTNGNSVIAYITNDTQVGVLGFDTSGNLIVRPNYQTNSNYYDVIHSGNIGSQSVANADSLGGISSNRYIYSKLLYNGDLNAADLYYGQSFTLRVGGDASNVPSYMVYGNILYIGNIDTGYMLAGSYSKDLLYFRRGTNANNSNQTINTNAWKTIAFTDSNVASATKLSDDTAYTAWGQTFFENGKPKSVSGDLTLANEKCILTKDNNGNAYAALYLSNQNNLLLGFGTSMYGYTTKVQGNEVWLNYGTNHSVGFVLNSSGNVTIGASDLASTTTKLYVDGGICISNNYGYDSIDTDGTVRTLMYLSTGNALVIGNDNATLGNATYISGNEVRLRYGSSKNVGLLLNPSGNVLIGTTSDNGYKLDVNGKVNFAKSITLTPITLQISTSGWYRAAISTRRNSQSSSFIVHLNRGYNNTNNESYTFAVNVAYNGGINISQIGGYANRRIITKVRVDYVNSGVLYFDFYTSTNESNSYNVAVEGSAYIDSIEVVSAAAGTTYEMETTNGMSTSRNFVAKGNIEGEGLVIPTAPPSSPQSGKYYFYMA